LTLAENARLGLRASAPFLALAAMASGHAGPPFPIVSERDVGPYRVSIWTDPDATDDGTPGGQFWILLHPVHGTAARADSRVTVVARPLERPGGEERAVAEPQGGEPSRYFARVVLDHEGPWRVEVLLEGPGGASSTSAEVSATYDLRPSLLELPILVLPFLLVGFLWLKALRVRRRRSAVG
jgi:hypothetical protein